MPELVQIAGQDSTTTTREVLTDTSGRLVLSPGTGAAALFPGTPVGSSALEKSHVVSAAACTLRSAKALNNSGSDAWLYVIDAAALPSNGATPDRIPVPVPAGSVNGDVWQGGTTMSNGCVLALSSTLATLTLIAGNDAWFDAEIDS